jgi:large subunit ribosomal protein L6
VSRVGKAPITVPQGVTVQLNNNVVTAKGPKGELSVKIHPDMQILFQDNVIQLQRPSDNKMHRSLHGLSRTLIANIINGVQKGYSKRLEIVGVGFRAEIKGKNLFLSLGFSHQIIFVPPPEIKISVEGTNIIIIEGIHKGLVGQVAAKIRSLRPPEPYKGKGIRYLNEVVRKKAGKTAA